MIGIFDVDSELFVHSEVASGRFAVEDLLKEKIPGEVERLRDLFGPFNWLVRLGLVDEEVAEERPCYGCQPWGSN